MAVGSLDLTVTEEKEDLSRRRLEVDLDEVVTLSESVALALAPVLLEAGLATAGSIEIAVATTSEPALSAPAPVVPVTGVAPLVLFGGASVLQ